MEEQDDKSATKDCDYFDMGQVGSDQEQKDKGTPITPITKYVELSSKMLIELRNHKVNQVSESTGNDDNDDESCVSRNASSINLNHVQEDDKHTQNLSTDVPGTTMKKKLSSINVKVIKPSSATNFDDYLKNVRSSMTHPRANSVRLKHSSNTDHNALAESGVDYGSPGSFQDRAKAFSKIPNATPLRGGRQVRGGKIRMKMT